MSMKQAGLTALAILLAFAPAAAGLPARHVGRDAHNPHRFADPTGDAGAGTDIAGVTVSNTAAGRIRFEIAVANAPVLLADDRLVTLFIDADVNESTGWGGGFEYAIQTTGSFGRAYLGRWDGTQFVDAPAPSLVKIWAGGTGMTFEISSTDLGGTRDFWFWAATEVLPPNDVWDDTAPDGDDVWRYTLAMPHVKSARAAFSPAGPRAGKPYRVTGVTFTLDTGEQLPATGYRCRATLAGRPLRGTGAGGCAYSLPRNAKGKRLAITIAATLDYETRTLRSSHVVR